MRRRGGRGAVRRGARVLPLASWALVALAWTGCSKGEPTPAEAPPPPPPEPAAQSPPVAVEVVENPTYDAVPILTGWITASVLKVRERAGADGAVLDFLVKGDRVDIYEDQPVGGEKWYRIEDVAGYVSGWIAARYVSGQKIQGDFRIVKDYKEPRTPTVMLDVQARYVGNRACKRCHSQPHGEFEEGEFGVWAKHFHADAYRSLGRAYSIAVARHLGIEDPTRDWRCVKCHVTAYGLPAERIGPNYRETDGVGCEACHGPGEEYLEPHYDKNASPEALRAMGFVIYRTIEDRDVLCRSCHNELSPTYKPFNVKAFSAAIRHWEERLTQTIVEVVRPDEVATVAPVKPETVPEIVAQQQAAAEIQEYTRAIKDAIAEPAIPPPPEATPQVEELPIPPPPPPTATEAQPRPPPPRPAPPAAAGATARLAGVAPEMMLNLQGAQKGQVFFPHNKHLKWVYPETEADNCQVCHHKTNPPDVPTSCGKCHKVAASETGPSREQAFHNSCRLCHREEGGGPSTCSQCHN